MLVKNTRCQGMAEEGFFFWGGGGRQTKMRVRVTEPTVSHISGSGKHP